KESIKIWDQQSGNSSSSSSESDDEVEDISSDKERTKEDGSKKAKEENYREEQPVDDQTDKVQAKVLVPDPQAEKPVEQLLSSSLTLSSADYGNQFLTGNLDVSLTDVLIEPDEAEVQSLVDVPVHQENPDVQRTLLVDKVMTMIQETTTYSPKQQPPPTQSKGSKTKVILKKSKKPKD
ncbi:hypothetical protein Tco_0113963, partial [Tanacetum coccineum]